MGWDRNICELDDDETVRKIFATEDTKIPRQDSGITVFSVAKAIYI